MADSWNPLTPASYGFEEVVPASKLNTELRDRMQALFNGLVGDVSADADVVQAGRSGTLPARPAAAKAGRTYYATDLGVLFLDDGTRWLIISVSPNIAEEFHEDFHYDIAAGNWVRTTSGSAAIANVDADESLVHIDTGATINSIAELHTIKRH